MYICIYIYREREMTSYCPPVPFFLALAVLCGVVLVVCLCV